MKGRHQNPKSPGRAGCPVGLLLAVWMPLSAAACGGGAATAVPTAPGSATSPASSPSTPSPGTAPSTSSSLQDVLQATIQDEYHAQAVYQGVLDDFGTVMPFANVIRAEEAHASAIGRLFTVRGMDVPPSVWSTASVPHFASLAAACAAAADAEVANVALYDRYLGTDLPADARTVFTNNRAASLNNHLPAFSRCR